MKIISKNKLVNISEVENWKDNPRDYKSSDLERLKKQIQELGQYKPLIVEKVNRKYITLGGNMRLKAYKELGIKEVEITEVKCKDKAERIKLSLSDNDRVGYYLEDQLAKQIQGLDINLKDFKIELNIPIINLNDVINRPIKEKEITKDNIGIENKCPKCGYEW